MTLTSLRFSPNAVNTQSLDIYYMYMYQKYWMIFRKCQAPYFGEIHIYKSIRFHPNYTQMHMEEHKRRHLSLKKVCQPVNHSVGWEKERDE